MTSKNNVTRPLRVSTTPNLHGCPNENLSEYLRQGVSFCKRMGFDAVDFHMPFLSLVGDRWEEVVTTAAQDAQAQGMRYEICHLPFTNFEFMTEDKLAAFNAFVHQSIDAAAILGVDYAVLHPNTYTIPLKNFRRQEAYDAVMAHLSPFVEHASKVGVNIVVENMRVVHKSVMVHRYGDSPDEICEIADSLGVGICWDFGHANIDGLKQSEALAHVGSRVKVLHVNDNFGEEDIHIPPFCGNVDWKDAMQGLKNIGFNGLLNYEVLSPRIPDSAREAFARYLIAAAEELLALFDS